MSVDYFLPFKINLTFSCNDLRLFFTSLSLSFLLSSLPFPQEVSDLRLKSSSYCQELSDLQEVLQWKDKKMAV